MQGSKEARWPNKHCRIDLVDKGSKFQSSSKQIAHGDKLEPHGLVPFVLVQCIEIIVCRFTIH